jgi:NAD(P)-dependent dehydrogenase (short-subunit alcohol dehydrogenase family)
MDVAGAGVVVTGAGQGIGRAMVHRLAAHGARVVVNDLDDAAALAVASETGSVALPGDAASQDGVAALVAASRHALGEIDVYVANAGIDVGRGLDASPQEWARSLEVNLMAHVRAAQHLVPRWLDRGRGRFVVTASAAGLLTMLGSPTYAVTKHAAVAFAEWLSASYGHRGITVQAICPQGVRTGMLARAGAAQQVLGRETVLEPDDVARALLDGLRDDRFLILPHPEVAGYYALRATEPDRWLAGMRRLQRRLDDTPSAAPSAEPSAQPSAQPSAKPSAVEE